MIRLVMALCLGLFLMAGNSFAQVNTDTEGLYSGQANVTNYISATPTKSKSSLTIEFFQGEAILGAPDDSGTPVYFPGTAAQIGTQVFVNFPLEGGFSAKGRLALKGKPGKQSLSGRMTYHLQDYIGYVDLDVKLKQIPNIN